MLSDTTKLEIKVGSFLIGVLLLAVALLVYIGIKKDLFAERAVYYVVSKTGEGIEPGIGVKLKGFKIGQVRNVVLEDIDTVRSEIEILKRYMKWFKRNCKISLERPIIGGAFFKLTPGPQDSPVLSQGTTIALEDIPNLQEELQKQAKAMLAEVQQVVINARIISDRIADENGTVQNILRNMDEISTRLASSQGMLTYLTKAEPVQRIDAILANTEKTTAGLNDMVHNADARIVGLEPIQEEIHNLMLDVRTLVQEYQGLRESFEPIISNVDAITGEVRDATQNLSGLRAQGEYSLRLGTELMQRLKETWPLARGTDSETPPMHPLP